jgi:tetratricopeptide (TPR) repeat protein
MKSENKFYFYYFRQGVVYGLFLLAICFFFGSHQVFADVIKLKSGNSLSGVIITQDDLTIQFRTDVGVIFLRKDAIASIEKETPELNYIRAGDLLVEKGDLDKATTQYTLALQINPKATDAAAKLKTVSARIEQLRMERLAPNFVDGDRMVSQGRYKEALAYYQDIYNKNPNSELTDYARKKIAATYFELGKYGLDHISKSDATTAFEKSLEFDRKNPEVYFTLGSVYLAAGRQEQNAIAQFTLGLRLNPNHQGALFQRAEAYYRLGLYGEAVEDYKSAIAIETPDGIKQTVSKQIAAAYLNLGKKTAELNAADTALYYFQQALVYRPDYGLAYYEIGNMQFKRNKYEEAGLMLEKAVLLEPNRTEIYKLLGDTNVKVQRYAEAIKRYQRATELTPNDNVVWTALADAYRYRGMYPDAIKNYEKSLEIEPNYFPAHLGLGMTYENTEQFDQAILHYRRATELRPDDNQAHLALGTILYRQLKQNDAARKEFDTVLNANPQNPAARFGLGQINMAEGFYSNAIGDFQDAIKAKPDYAEAYSEMGKAYRYRKNYDFALEAYGHATALNPNLAEPYQGMGILYHQVFQDYPKALQNYQQFLKVGGKDPQVLSWIQEVKLSMGETK